MRSRIKLGESVKVRTGGEEVGAGVSMVSYITGKSSRTSC